MLLSIGNTNRLFTYVFTLDVLCNTYTVWISKRHFPEFLL